MKCSDCPSAQSGIVTSNQRPSFIRAATGGAECGLIRIRVPIEAKHEFELFDQEIEKLPLTMNENNEQPQLITAEALASLLSVSVRTIRSYQKEGRFPYVRISPGTVRFSVGEVMAALEQRKVPARTTRSKEQLKKS